MDKSHKWMATDLRIPPQKFQNEEQQLLFKRFEYQILRLGLHFRNGVPMAGYEEMNWIVSL